jgi:nucleotide-binding universal stress UspA family protein
MTQKWLLPVDGSEASLHAVRLAIEEASNLPARPELLLVNVQAPVSGDVSRFINRDTLKEFHEENGAKALVEARAILEGAGLPYAARVLIGEAAPMIADLASHEKCTRIVMGARGLGSVIGMLMGSVTTKVVHLSPVPVLLVK